jgi:hypothetical protein
VETTVRAYVPDAVPPSSFKTDRPACFLATFAELRAALPDWRVPLSSAVARLTKNPFTGKPLTARTRDPGPDNPARIPSFLPFDHALLPNEEDWEHRYIALDLALSGEAARAPNFDDWEGVTERLEARGLNEDALLGGAVDAGDPRWVVTVPRRLVAGLCELELGQLPRLLGEWNSRSPSASTEEDLRDLWLLARRSTAQERGMFLWLDAPPHRCSVHRPHRDT